LAVDGRALKFNHILFAGKLPRFLGFDKGPIAIPGGRATISQGQIYKSAGRTTSFAASIRVVSDMADNSVITNMPGGPSDRRFSRWYSSDLQNWISGKYKTGESSIRRTAGDVGNNRIIRHIRYYANRCGKTSCATG
jgi:acyl-homoserine lactone acylase PvdQ